MRWPPDSRKARAGIPGLEINPALHKSLKLNSQSAEALQDTLTAVPVGKRWCIKALSADGGVRRFGSFDGRHSALGAAVLLAEQAGVKVIP